jgi:hypothetical protein
MSIATATPPTALTQSFSDAWENVSHEEVNSEIYINTITLKIS